MDSNNDDYYYRLGRHMAAIERDNRITKTQLAGITPQQFRDWAQGYDDMVAMFDWRRSSVKKHKKA